jgi:hypothetical protein
VVVNAVVAGNSEVTAPGFSTTRRSCLLSTTSMTTSALPTRATRNAVSEVASRSAIKYGRATLVRLATLSLLTAAAMTLAPMV